MMTRCSSSYGIQRDDKVAIEHVAFTIVEGDDVGIVIVLQVFAIDGQDMLVIAEQVAHLTDLLAVGGSYTANPCSGFATFDVREFDVF